jgi:hypothetical protein|eukprot:scaffold14820_cov428-Alexandrium_tamarense.AAC.8
MSDILKTTNSSVQIFLRGTILAGETSLPLHGASHHTIFIAPTRLIDTMKLLLLLTTTTLSTAFTGFTPAASRTTFTLSRPSTFTTRLSAVEEGTTPDNIGVNGTSEKKKVIILGADGFCGWPTSLYLSDMGHDVVMVDNLSRRNIDVELGCDSLTPIQSPDVRAY